MANLVAIVGRPNVGKSTLFNRLTNTRHAIVSDEAGTTRDRQYGKCEWNGREFSVVDTGGWVVNSEDIFEEEIRKQVLVATEEADLVLFLVDIQNGLTDLDVDVANILRRSKLPVVLVANKADDGKHLYDQYEFYRLGLGDPYCVSAATGSGTGDLLDLVVSKLSTDEIDDVADGTPRFAVVGRPNAGKSSIINAFIGEDRNIVTDIAGTTRDSIYTKYDKFGFDFYLVDTAGIRKKGKVNEDLEYYSVIRSIRAIENSDVCVLMIDATRGIESQDLNIFSLIQKNKKGLVVCVNKWDLVEEKSQKVITTFTNAIRERLAPFTDFPILFISAMTKQRIFKVLETVQRVLYGYSILPASTYVWRKDEKSLSDTKRKLPSNRLSYYISQLSLLAYENIDRSSGEIPVLANLILQETLIRILYPLGQITEESEAWNAYCRQLGNIFDLDIVF